MLAEIGQGLGVEEPRAQRDVLAGPAELREVEVDRVDQGYRHRIVDDGVAAARLWARAFSVSRAVSETPSG